MIKAFLRLILIGFFTCLVFAFILLGLRYLGDNRSFQSFDHPLLNLDKKYIFSKGGGLDSQYPPYSLEALKWIIEKNDFISLELPIIRTIDGHWVIYPSFDLEDLTNKSGKIQLAKWEDIKELDIGFHFKKDPSHSKSYNLVELEDVLKLVKDKPIILNFLDPQGKFAKEISELETIQRNQNHLIIRSTFAKFNREIKKLRPLWVMGSDLPSIERAKIYYHLGILSLFTFKEDIVFFKSTHEPNQDDMLVNFSNEISRQKRLMYLDTDSDLSELNSNLDFKNYQGIVTNYPLKYLSFFTE